MLPSTIEEKGVTSEGNVGRNAREGEEKREQAQNVEKSGKIKRERVKR